MRSNTQNTTFFSLWSATRVILLIASALTASLTHAATVWTGPNIGFFHQQGGASDSITPVVALSRNAGGGLFNTAAGETFSNGINSPVGTMWAFGNINNFSTLSYVTFDSIRNGALGDLQLAILNKPMVLHLTNEDIYISIMFTNWTQHGNQTGIGSFGYTRSTAPAATPPSVSITNPAPGAIFTAPANVNISASASVSGGTVTNVSFFGGATLFGSVTTPPFSITASNLTAGSYALTAVATAGGLSTTSAVVNITVQTSSVTIISSPHISGGQFIFSYNAAPGSTYVVQMSSTLSNWISLSTNIANSGTVSVTNPVGSGPAYFRVGKSN